MTKSYDQLIIIIKGLKKNSFSDDVLMTSLLSVAKRQNSNSVQRKAYAAKGNTNAQSVTQATAISFIKLIWLDPFAITLKFIHFYSI